MLWLPPSGGRFSWPRANPRGLFYATDERCDTRGVGRRRTAPPVELYTLTNANGVEMRAITTAESCRELKVPDSTGNSATSCSASTRSQGYLDRIAVLRRHRRPLRQPHREGPVHARRQDVQAGDQQRRRTTCTAGSRASTRWSGQAEPIAGTQPASCSRTPAPTAKKGYPGTLQVTRHLHADRRATS